MQRMSIAMDHAFGNFLKSSRGSIISTMGEEQQGCVKKPQKTESHADANKANNNYANERLGKTGMLMLGLTGVGPPS